MSALSEATKKLLETHMDELLKMPYWAITMDTLKMSPYLTPEARQKLYQWDILTPSDAIDIIINGDSRIYDEFKYIMEILEIEFSL